MRIEDLPRGKPVSIASVYVKVVSEWITDSPALVPACEAAHCHAITSVQVREL